MAINGSDETMALQLLEKCVENGIFTENFSNDFSPEEQLNEDLLEAGIMDSMSLTMLAELINQDYGIEIELPLFIAELRSLNKVASYLEEF